MVQVGGEESVYVVRIVYVSRVLTREGISAAAVNFAVTNVCFRTTVDYIRLVKTLDNKEGFLTRLNSCRRLYATKIP